MNKILSNIDRPLAIIFFCLLVFGLLMLSSAGSGIGLAKFGDSYFFVKRQLLYGVIPGSFGLFLALYIPYERFRAYVAPFFIAVLVLLGMVLIPSVGQSYGGAQSWLVIGSFSFQPSEFLKLALVIYLAAWLSTRKDLIKDFKQGFLLFCVLLGLSLGLVLLQPDLGTASIIAVIALGMYFLAGAPLRYVGAIIVAGLVSLAGLIAVAPYRFARITTFINPDIDPQGAGYQIKQAFIAIGSGGWFGRGFGLSRAKFQYLPESAGDSIFAITAEELGFFVSLVVVVLFVALMFRGIVIAKRVPDSFGQLLIGGILIWIVGQAFINIGAMVGVFPLTGIPLPFISYGGTALFALMIAVGIILNVSRSAKL